MTEAGDLRPIIDLASGDEDGAPCSPPVRAALLEVMERRRGPNGPAAPALGPLVVRRRALPDWWGRGNLLLAAPSAKAKLSAGMFFGQRAGNLGVLGEEAVVNELAFMQTDALIVLGDRVRMDLCNLAAGNGGTILIGEETTAGPWARVDARNGGAVLVGADNMWAERVTVVTDDMHAIRETGGRRVNRYGGRIVVEPHVWLCEDVRIAGGGHVGAHSVVGLAAFVRSPLPGGSVSVGSPAYPIRHGVTWTREDMP